MTRKQQRTTMIAAGVGVLGLAVGLVMFALRDSIVFFYTPSDVIEKKLTAGPRIRLGGLVEKGSLKKGDEGRIDFAVTDTKAVLNVTYRGVLPDLFREGQGVVTEGRLDAAGLFIADSVLAKHDETYMPAEVAKALKEKGVWQGDEKGKGGKPDKK
jgi:cytochrome c-type biogenesis protein CcmE